MSERAKRPIGVFDSGIGGLTVVRALSRRLPGESIVYFGDTARLPYGPKSPGVVLRYAREAATLLLDRGVKALVVACNTATAHALEALTAELPIPVLGVVEPGARAAIAATRTGRIGVHGTRGTIDSGAYDRTLRALLERVRVYAQPCPLFVPLVEEGFLDHPATRLVAEEYLRPLCEVEVDVVVLGCTHYPLLTPLLSRVMGPDVTLVDSAAETARAAHDRLRPAGLLAPDGSAGSHTFLVSDSPLRFREVGQRFLGRLVARVEQAPPDRFAA
ncbi:MAG: glutamate racemase [Gemmatimonadota bacterium]